MFNLVKATSDEVLRTYYRTWLYYRFWPYYQILEVSKEHCKRVRLANRGRLLLRIPGPVPFGTYNRSNVEIILSQTCHVYGPFEFRTSLGTSILLLITQVLSKTCMTSHIIVIINKHGYYSITREIISASVCLIYRNTNIPKTKTRYHPP